MSPCHLFCTVLSLFGLAVAVRAEEGLPPPGDPVAEYARHAATTCVPGERLVLPVDLRTESMQLETGYDEETGRLRILYHMAFNQLTEGWNWHPEALASGGDYYTFKYLPLGSLDEARGRYRGEDKIGTPQEFAVAWRYDYFLAFDNPEDFYARDAGDDMGFAAAIAMPAATAHRLAGGDLRMAARVRLAAQCVTDSTTFWKATSARPVDFTLKKRYLIGRLADVWFYDAATGQLLARIEPRGRTAD